jgi:hypothetical protein
MGGILRKFFRSWLGLGVASGFGIDIALQRNIYEAFSNRLHHFWAAAKRPAFNHKNHPIGRFAFALVHRPWLLVVSLIIFVVAIGAAAAAWDAWQAHSKRVEEDKLFYDICLIQNGNTVTCDAAMRMRARYGR